VRKATSFALLARTSLEWALFDFALALVGAVAAPIYANSSARDVQYVLDHSQVVGVLVEDEEQRAKVSSVEHVISFSELDALRERGRAYRLGASGSTAGARRLDRRGRPVTFSIHPGRRGRPRPA
jgi:long-chain acyl-CoA synthetase